MYLLAPAGAGRAGACARLPVRSGACVGCVGRPALWGWRRIRRQGGGEQAFSCLHDGSPAGSAGSPGLQEDEASVLAQYFVSSQYWFSIHDQMDLFIGPGFTRDACRIYRSAAGCYRRTYSVCTRVDFARCHFAFLRVVPS